MYSKRPFVCNRPQGPYKMLNESRTSMEISTEQMIGQGNTSEIYRVDDGKILKLFRSGFSRGIVEREYQNHIAAQKVLACVPLAYEMVEVRDRLGIVYEEIQGKDLLKVMTTSVGKINEYARRLAHYHLDIQKPVAESMPAVKDKLEEDLNAVELLPAETKEFIRNYLHQLPDGDALCHFDFHPGNIMLRDDQPVFLDWMTACRGDACADVARTSILLKNGNVPHAPWLVRKLISAFQHHMYKIYIKEYLLISKRTIEDIHAWELPVAAARLREWISEKEKQTLLRVVREQCEKIARGAV